MTDLNDLLPDSSGWVLREAYDINNSGQIVGYGTYNGQGRAFLLTPESAAIAAPEPASFVLFGLGVIGMAFVAVRRRHESQTAKA